MDPTRTREALVRAQIRCKTKGNPVALKFQTWPNGRPQLDPTSGAFLSDGTNDAVESACLTRVFTHFVQPTTSNVRMMAEVQQGDMIADFVIPIVTIDDPGSTGLDSGDILDIVTFNATNRGAATPATRLPDFVYLHDLKFTQLVTYPNAAGQSADRGGIVWNQARISDELSRSWETNFAGMIFGQAFLFRRQT